MSHKFRKGMQTYETSQQEYIIREETLNGRTYVVVPVTMMMEGVHAGSHGALLHTAEELGKIPESWNGIPVTIGHPQIEGKPVSANSPEVLEAWQIGVVFNTIINDLKLKSEAWLEKDKLATNENLNDRIANGEIIEVSVGVFSEDELIEGIYHNETYVAVARNLRPDHLAILPNQIGACSIEDGCGIRTNEAVQINEDTEIVIINLKEEEQNMSDAKCTPCVAKRVNALIANAETQYAETDREWLETLQEIQLDKMMPKALTPEEIQKAKDDAAKLVKNEITPEMAVNALKEALKGQDDFINLMPTNMQEQTRSALKLHASHKSTLIEGILANTEEGTWTKEELGVYEVEKLEKISKTAGVKAPATQFNYSAMGAGSGIHDNAQDEVPFLAPVGINFETK